MGREALCTCVWNGVKSNVKALLEPPELILRGELRRRVSFSKMKNVKADGDLLHFNLERDSVSLELGYAMAAKWADALLKPPPTLAKKLGITPEMTVRMIGPVDDAALESALAQAKGVSQRKGELILARVDTPADLNAALKERCGSTQGRSSYLAALSQGSGASVECEICTRNGAGNWDRGHKGCECFSRVHSVTLC